MRYWGKRIYAGIKYLDRGNCDWPPGRLRAQMCVDEQDFRAWHLSTHGTGGRGNKLSAIPRFRRPLSEAWYLARDAVFRACIAVEPSVANRFVYKTAINALKEIYYILYIEGRFCRIVLDILSSHNFMGIYLPVL